MTKLYSRRTRLLAVLLGLVMTCISLPLSAAADADAECLLLRIENIEVPKNSDGTIAAGWSISPYPAGSYYGLLSDEPDKYLGLINTNVGTAGFNANSYASARICLDGNETAENGVKNYYIWVASRSDSARASYVAVDESEEFIKMNPQNSGHGTMAWATAQNNAPFSLSGGVHTLKIKVGVGNSSNLQAVIITDDASFSPIGKTYADLAKLALVDTVPPTIADVNAFSYAYGADGAGTVTFPNVTDKGSLKYFYKIGNKTGSYAGTNTSVQLEGIKPLEELKIEWYATDCLNTVSKSWTVIASPVEVKSFAPVKTGETEALTDLSSIAAGNKIKLETKITNRVAEPKSLKLMLTLYTKDYERMAANIEADVALTANEKDKPATVEITVPEGFNANDYILSASLWEAGEQEPYITGIELRGSAS